MGELTVQLQHPPWNNVRRALSIKSQSGAAMGRTGYVDDPHVDRTAKPCEGISVSGKKPT
jgi:hypothetical protein